MNTPEWADPQLSKDLSVLRTRGENQDIEYMELFPQNVRELAKEIAAFATSNAGTILIGVSNTGDLIGLEGADSYERRDELLRRIEGICRGAIKPAITPVAKFAVEDGKIVLVLTIPKGKQPIYYSNNVPYLRHITESRPAEPHEVIELVQSQLSREEPASAELDDGKARLLSDLGAVVTNVLIYADEFLDRNANPWLEMWRTEFRSAATELRELAAQEIAIEQGVNQDANELANALDKAGTLRLTMGSWGELKDLVQHVVEISLRLKRRWIDPMPLSMESLAHVRDLIMSSSRKIQNLESRSHEMIESGRIEEVQAEAAEIGKHLLRVSYYDIDAVGPGISRALRTVARELHLLETRRLYMDGGASMQAIARQLSESSQKLADLADTVSG